MSSPIPVALCGKTTQIGQGVIMGLKPEYEVIHFLQSSARGATELPHILQGHAPPARTDEAPGESNIGSKNYAQKAQAVILGGGHTDDDIALMRDACRAVGGEGILSVPWIRPDLTRETPPLGTREYGVVMVQRCKAALEGLRERGEMGADGVFWY